ncbi:hypothetical protein EVB55_148 [Rhizobium phage RHph_Y68]|uniref:Uncharacterized protein n=1 Tax=Rhizobium phage RHph_Y68 TaxID=2509787 RepID=A0A7S5QY10_9CAUD|nr:hypothetical protein PP934_gp148 [Rhizobium phage RHph_Y68]QIG68083.1 hypothetical protein EVB55_148 [Rhizobium phage RHph_Y68]
MLSEIFTMIRLAPGSFARYLVFVPINVILVLLSWLLSPFLATASVLFRVNKLPGFLQWFSTIDDDLDGGQHQLEWKEGVFGLELIIQRTLWIIRNPAHGWQSKVLGYNIHSGTSRIYAREWKNVSSLNAFKGFISRTGDGKIFFTIKADIYLTKKFYLKLWIGWNERAYDGVYSHLLFQPFLPKTKG